MSLGCLLEGETVLLLACATAHLGWLALPEVAAVAAARGFPGDQIAFAVGRAAGPALFRRRRALARGIERARRRLGRRDAWAALGMRHAIGMRRALPHASGASAVPRQRFAILHAARAIPRATLFGVVGCPAGAAVVAALRRFGHDAEIALAVVAVAGIAFVAWRRSARGNRDASRTL